MSSVPFHTVVTLTATVTSGSTPLTVGQVNFCDATSKYCTDIHLLGAAQLTAAGTATFRFIPGPGTHTYEAVFRGTNKYAGSSSLAKSLLVGPQTPTPAASTALQPSEVQGNYTLTATVASEVPPTPTGNVQFLDTTNANYLLGSNALMVTGQSNIAFVRAGQTAFDAGSMTLAEADFNNDGIPDLVTANLDPNSFTVLIGKGDGTFTASTTNLGASNIIQAVVGDFNADGNMDIAVANIIGTVFIYLGNGDGTFQSGQTITTAKAKSGSGFLAAADFNGDGIEDLALTVQPQKPGVSTYVSILLGNGDGTFTSLAGGPAIGHSTEILAADFNDDGKADLVTANQYDDTLTVLLGNGDGTFAAPATLPTVSDIYGLAIGDLNNDGIPDMAVAYQSGDPLSILLGKGNGTFTTLAPDPTLVAYPEALAIADMNGDGNPDIIAPNTDDGLETLNVFLGHGDGTFTFDTSSPTQTGYDAASIIPGDFNGDGREDFAVLFQGDQPEPLGFSVNVAVFAGLPFTTAITSISGISAVGTGIHNLDAVYLGDGNYGSSTSPTEPILAQRVPTTLVLTVNPTTSTFGQSVTLTATLTPYFEQDHSASPTVTFYSGLTPIGTTTLTNGVATLTTTALAAGYDNLSAAYPGDINFVPSSSNVVSFLVSGAPSLTPTTTAFSITAGDAPVTTVPPNTLVTFTATVRSGGANLTTGQVNFCDASAKYCTDIHLLATSTVTQNGIATFKFVPGIGAHSYKAVFVANKTYASSSSAALPLAVTSPNVSPTTSTLVATGQPGDYTLTDTVIGVPYLVPTGNISFVDTTNNNYLLGTAPLSVGDDLTFYPSQTLPTSGYPVNVLKADFNGDGIPDVAVTYYGGSGISIYLGNGDGTFTHSADLAYQSYEETFAAADFTGDGCVDLAFPNYVPTTGEFTFQVLPGNCDGTFGSPILAFDFGDPESSLEPLAMAAADFNGDGKLDLAVADFGNEEGNVSVLLGNGDGTFKLVAPAAQAGIQPLALAIADFNSDGHLDIAALDNGGGVFMLFGNGDGTFSVAGTVLDVGNGTPDGIVAADFNLDGKPDLAITGYTGNNVGVYLGNGDGTFTVAPAPSTGTGPIPIAVADFNGDGIPDLAVGNYGTGVAGGPQGTATVLLGKGDGTFAPISTTLLAGSSPVSVVTGDFNSDGVPDILFANQDSETLTVLLAASAASATITDVSVVGTGTHYGQASFPAGGGNAASLSNLVPLDAEQVPTNLTLAAAPSGGSAVGQQVTLTAALDKFYAQDHYASGNVAFSSNGQSLGTAAVQNNGMATLTTTALPTGTDNLKAVYPGDINFLGSTAAIVPYPVAAQATAPTITFTVPNHTYGDPPFAVAAASNSPGAFTYSVVSGPATISGSTVTLTGAGTVVLEASQAASGNYSAGSAEASFNVSKQAQTITFPQPISPVPLGSGSIALVATASSGLAVTFTVVSGPGTISGGNTLTFSGAGSVVVAANQAGNATFSAAPTVTRSIVVIAPVIHVNLTAAPNPVFVQNPVALRAAVSQVSIAPQPTGTITFADGGTPLSTVALSGNLANLLVSTLTPGYHSLTATYNGDAQYPAVTSPVVIELVEDFSLTSPNPNMTISHGGTAVYTLLVGPVGAAVTAQPVALSLGPGAPDGSTITFSTQSIPPSSSITPVTLTIRTPNYPVGPFSLLRGDTRGTSLALLALGAGLLGSMRRRRALLRRLGCAVVLLAGSMAALGLVGCGTGWKTQRYTMTVTGVSGNVTHTTTLTLTTQCADGQAACPIVQ